MSWKREGGSWKYSDDKEYTAELRGYDGELSVWYEDFLKIRVKIEDPSEVTRWISHAAIEYSLYIDGVTVIETPTCITASKGEFKLKCPPGFPVIDIVYLLNDVATR